MFYADTMDECAKLCYDRGHGCKAAVFQMLPKRVAPKGGPCSAVRHPWKLGLTCQSKVGWPVNKTVPDFSSKLRSHILTCIECPDSDGDRKDRMNITPPEWDETMDQTTRPMLTAKPARAHKKMTVVRPKWPKKPTSRKPLRHDNRTRAGTITVMTFNTWRMGEKVSNGLAKVAKYINMVNADIVGIQENVRGDEIDTLMRLLNQSYKKCSIVSMKLKQIRGITSYAPMRRNLVTNKELIKQDRISAPADSCHLNGLQHVSKSAARCPNQQQGKSAID
uniref:Apple domain-containing protein n=1 Tax=Romanomermis culicivorax TaxID=13658 RepID=A0A915HJ92_ROMCU